VPTVLSYDAVVFNGNHPIPGSLEGFMRGDASRDEARAIVRHLLTGCPKCVAVTRKLWRIGEQSRALKALAAGASVIQIGRRRRLLDADGL